MSRFSATGRNSIFLFVLIASIALVSAVRVEAGGGITFEQLAALRSAGNVVISPDGELIAYTLSVPRQPGAGNDGSAWSELHVVAFGEGVDRTFVGGEVKVSGVRFSPGGELITYLAKRDGDEHKALWAIPVAGGESKRLIAFDTGIDDYRLSPDGAKVAFVAREPESEGRKEATDKGYSQEVFEEDWLPKRVWIAALPQFNPPANNPSTPIAEVVAPTALKIKGSVFHVRWSPDGSKLAVDPAPSPLVDHRYMLRRVTIVDSTTGEVRAVFDNPGKLGDFDFSPDGKMIAMISAADPNDPASGRILVAPSAGGSLSDVLPDHEAHISAFAWQDPTTLMVLSDEGEETRFAEVDVNTLEKKTHAFSNLVNSGVRTPIMTAFSLSGDGQRVALIGDASAHPSEVFAMEHGDAAPRRLTDNNPWLKDVDLVSQEVFRHETRDGLELGGVLFRPAGSEGPAPLLLMVHGGPEGHRRNGWLTRYSSPAQLAAAQGYAVFFPNYRGSTGRGVAFSKLGQADAAGGEFDDLVDAVDALVEAGIADKDRVGITGGSYGGYATAWCSTVFTERFKAGVMFVGISNDISKGLTTEIPLEDMMVHTMADPWTNLNFRLERSPINYMAQSRTALLIAGGTADSRVHPSQSLQFYRGLKLIGKTPVRYVRYPGEHHGNSRAASRDDYARRLMRWMDHFVKEENTELPPWELVASTKN